MHKDIGDVVSAGAPEYGKQGQTVLVVSRERVGRVFVVQELRAQGLHTVISDNAQQAVRRMNGGQFPIAAIVIVGDLSDGTAESYQRWLRSQGHHALPLISIGSTVADNDAFARSVDPREWITSSAEVLHSLGLIDRRSTVRTTAGGADSAAAASATA